MRSRAARERGFLGGGVLGLGGRGGPRRLERAYERAVLGLPALQLALRAGVGGGVLLRGRLQRAAALVGRSQLGLQARKAGLQALRLLACVAQLHVALRQLLGEGRQLLLEARDARRALRQLGAALAGLAVAAVDLALDPHQLRLARLRLLLQVGDQFLRHQAARLDAVQRLEVVRGARPFALQLVGDVGGAGAALRIQRLALAQLLCQLLATDALVLVEPALQLRLALAGGARQRAGLAELLGEVGTALLGRRARAARLGELRRLLRGARLLLGQLGAERHGAGLLFGELRGECGVARLVLAELRGQRRDALVSRGARAQRLIARALDLRQALGLARQQLLGVVQPGAERQQIGAAIGGVHAEVACRRRHDPGAGRAVRLLGYVRRGAGRGIEHRQFGGRVEIGLDPRRRELRWQGAQAHRLRLSSQWFYRKSVARGTLQSRARRDKSVRTIAKTVP